jgi:hypothetical protein
MKSEINPLRNVPSTMNAHFDCQQFGNCEVFYTTSPDSRGKFTAIAYRGKGWRAVWYYSFSTEAKMDAHIQTFIEDCKRLVLHKLTQKAVQKTKNALVSCEVGDIFYTSWGYDQTNVDFYMITAFKGKTVTVVEIGSKTVSGSEGCMSSSVLPDKSNVRSEPFSKRLQAGYDGKPTFKISSFEHAKLTTETTPHYCSWGH